MYRRDVMTGGGQSVARVRKVFFAINCEEHPKYLFAVKERDPENLLLVFPKAENFELGGNQKILDLHISVHGKGISDAGTTIKTTVKATDIPTYDFAQYIGNKDRGWSTVLYCQVQPSPLEDRYNANVRSGDTLFPVVDYDPQSATLIYCVCITDKPWNIAAAKRFGVPFRYQQFSRYGVGVFYGFQNIPSSSFGKGVAIATSTPRIGGSDNVRAPLPIREYSPAQLAQSALALMQDTACRNVATLEDWMRQNGSQEAAELFKQIDPMRLTLAVNALPPPPGSSSC